MVCVRYTVMLKRIAHIALIAAFVGPFLFLQGCGTNRVTEVDRQYKRIVEMQQAKQDAIDEAEASIKPPAAGDASGHERMGDTYLASGNKALAYREYGKAIEADPNRIQTRQKMAYLLLRQGMWTEALREFGLVLEKSPGNEPAMMGKAAALTQLGQLNEACSVLRSVIKKNSASWQAHALLGSVLDRQNMFLKSADEFEKAIAINPRGAGLHQKLGRALYMAGKYRESASALLKAIGQNNRSPGIYGDLGRSLFKLGLNKEAYEAFSKAGDEAEACSMMGFMYLEEKQYTESIQYFDKAINLKPAYYAEAEKGLESAKAAMTAESLNR